MIRESNILRLAMVMEDSASTTLDKYICKLVETVLFYDEQPSLDAVDISIKISDQFGLTFDVDEIKRALNKKGSGRVINLSGLYSTSLKANKQIASLQDPLDALRGHISKYAKISSDIDDEQVFLDCILSYLYYCFNSTKKNLLNLLVNIEINDIEPFSPSSDMASQINGFLVWDNDEKNKLIYNIIVSSYEYCMLTTKKDSILSKRIFKGKRFILDSNIIFRMAGINKDERKFVADSFVRKCKEVGIELCYTSETLGELHRVITSNVKHIPHITQLHCK